MRLKLIWNFKAGPSARSRWNKTGGGRLNRRNEKVRWTERRRMAPRATGMGTRERERDESGCRSCGWPQRDTERRGGRDREADWIIVIFKLTNDILHYHTLSAARPLLYQPRIPRPWPEGTKTSGHGDATLLRLPLPLIHSEFEDLKRIDPSRIVPVSMLFPRMMKIMSFLIFFSFLDIL